MTALVTCGLQVADVDIFEGALSSLFEVIRAMRDE